MNPSAERILRKYLEISNQQEEMLNEREDKYNKYISNFKKSNIDQDNQNSESIGKSNEKKDEYNQSKLIIIYLISLWESNIRPKLAKIKEVDINKISIDIMGDLQIVRTTFLHENSIISVEKFFRLKKIRDLLNPKTEIRISFESMQKIFAYIRKDLSAYSS